MCGESLPCLRFLLRARTRPNDWPAMHRGHQLIVPANTAQTESGPVHPTRIVDRWLAEYAAG